MSRQIYSNASAIDAGELDLTIDHIYWKDLSANEHPQAVELLRCNASCINWSAMSRNPTAIDILLKNFDKVDIAQFAMNPADAAVDYMLAHYTSADMPSEFIANPNERAVDYSFKHLISDFIERTHITLSIGKNLTDHADFKICDMLVRNYNPRAIKLLTACSTSVGFVHGNKFEWIDLAGNRSKCAIRHIKPHIGREAAKIKIYLLAGNPGIFKPISRDGERKYLNELRWDCA